MSRGDVKTKPEVVTVRLPTELKGRLDTASNTLRVLDKTVSLQVFCEQAILRQIEEVERGEHELQKKTKKRR